MSSKLLYFFGGVVGGCVGTYLVMKRRMDQQIEEEVESVRQAYSEKNAASWKLEQDEFGKLVRTNGTENERRKAEMMEKAQDIIRENSYTNDGAPIPLSDLAGTQKRVSYNLFSNPPDPKDISNGVDDDAEDLEILNTSPPEDPPKPYVLEPDEFSTAVDKFVNEEPNFDKVTLFYYNDGVLCSEEEEIITDIEGTVGEASLRRIGEYEPDVVYVRNEGLSTDYEVIRQDRNFVDIPDEDD